MKDETRKDVPAAEPEQETKRIPQPEETQYDLEEILEEALEEQYTPPTQENGETPEPEADQAAGQGEDALEPEETAEGEPEAISVPEAVAEGEQEETERFIQEQVTSALGDTYSEETLRKQEERAAQMRKVRAHQEAQQETARRKVRRKKAVEATVRNWKRTLIPKSQEPSEEGEQDNVIQMPVSKLKPFRDVMGRVTEKALHYADEMYEQSEPLDPEEELQEKYIPATDEEQPVRRKKWRKERKPRRLIKPEEDIPPSELAKRYSKGAEQDEIPHPYPAYPVCGAALPDHRRRRNLAPAPVFPGGDQGHRWDFTVGHGRSLPAGIGRALAGHHRTQTGTHRGTHLDGLRRGSHAAGQHLVLPGRTGGIAALLGSGVLLDSGLPVGGV